MPAGPRLADRRGGKDIMSFIKKGKEDLNRSQIPLDVLQMIENELNESFFAAMV